MRESDEEKLRSSTTRQASNNLATSAHRPAFPFFGNGGFVCVMSVLSVCWRIVAKGELANDSFLMMAGSRADSVVLRRSSR